VSLFALARADAAAGPEAAAELLAAGGSLSRDAVRDFLRRNPGFLGRSLTRDGAEKLKAAAAAAGIECALFAEEDIVLPPVPLKALKIDPKGAGFYAQAGGALTFIKYEDIILIAAAAYDAPVPPPSQEALRTGIFEGIRRLAGLPGWQPVSAQPPKETFFRADLLIASESGPVRLLLEPENLDFSPLGPGRSPSSLVNFRALLDTLSAPAFKAAKNAFLLAFLAGRPLAPLKTAGPEACDLGLSLMILLADKKPG